ncbi:MAG: SAM-dependent DNA methyltransferase, partial [Caldilinea sp.]
DRRGMRAMLCKTTVARKVLLYAWQNNLKMESASLYRLDAKKCFAASVDACLLLVKTHSTDSIKECKVFDSLDAQKPNSVFGFRDGLLVANIELFQKRRDLAGRGLKGWRSGIKHDCSKVFELRINKNGFVNGFGELVEIESQAVFPLLKSSDLATHRRPHRWMIVPQKTMDDDPSHLKLDAPMTWRYLTAHAQILDNRKSAIYRNRPRFSVFGVGAYSFAPWKVAISGLYKKLDFVQIAPLGGQPVVLDDTSYFFPCRSQEESNVLYELVMSEPAREFWSALVFWDAKRPITAQLLNALDLKALAKLLGKECEVTRTLSERQIVEYREGVHQRLLFREESPIYGDELVTDESKGNI